MIMEPNKWDGQKYSWQKVDDDYMRLMGRNAFHDVRIEEEDSTIVEVVIVIHSVSFRSDLLQRIQLDLLINFTLLIDLKKEVHLR